MLSGRIGSEAAVHEWLLSTRSYHLRVSPNLGAFQFDKLNSAFDCYKSLLQLIVERHAIYA